MTGSKKLVAADVARTASHIVAGMLLRASLDVYDRRRTVVEISAAFAHTILQTL